MTGERPTALVTGASGAIGTACCRALANAGLRVIAHYRNGQAAAYALRDEIDALPIAADLENLASLDELMASIATDPGRLDVLVHCAGGTRMGLTAVLPISDYDVLQRHERGAWYLTKLALRRFMVPSRRGRIISITSAAARLGDSGNVAYSMTKAGLEGMTRSLAREVGPAGILVNAVAPGLIESEAIAALPPAQRETILARVPVGRVGSTAEVAEVVCFLATSASYVNGAVIPVNGGMFS